MVDAWLWNVPMQTIRKSNRAGFSLVETLIGVSILSVSMLAAFTAQVAARNLMRESNETELARGILESTMERLLTEDAEELLEFIWVIG